jgi:hypothetical protein
MLTDGYRIQAVIGGFESSRCFHAEGVFEPTQKLPVPPTPKKTVV